jgi:hypothetical protein
VFRQQLFELLDVLKFLGLHIAPEFLQNSLSVSVGKILVVPPNAVEPPAQFVNQVVIVILTSLRLTDVLISDSVFVVMAVFLSKFPSGGVE